MIVAFIIKAFVNASLANSTHKYKMDTAAFVLPPGPIDYAEHVIQGLQAGYAGLNHQHNIHLVSDSRYLDLLIMSRLP